MLKPRGTRLLDAYSRDTQNFSGVSGKLVQQKSRRTFRSAERIFLGRYAETVSREHVQFGMLCMRNPEETDSDNQQALSIDNL